MLGPPPHSASLCAEQAHVSFPGRLHDLIFLRRAGRAQVNQLMLELDPTNHGHVHRREFGEWYTTQVRHEESESEAGCSSLMELLPLLSEGFEHQLKTTSSFAVMVQVGSKMKPAPHLRPPQLKQVFADPFDVLHACMRHGRHWCGRGLGSRFLFVFHAACGTDHYQWKGDLQDDGSAAGLQWRLFFV